MTAALLDAGATLSSSSEVQRVVAELAAEPGLPEELYARALEVAAEIASSQQKAQLLAALAAHLPPSDELRSSFLDVTDSIAASSEAKRALLALIEASHLPAPVCSAWLERAGRLAASSVTVDLLVEGAARCPGEARVWRTYIDVVEGVSASSEQRRALTALLDRDDLDAATLAEVAAAAERSIASSSEREVVLEHLARRPAA
jgi:hypothetical protein